MTAFSAHTFQTQDEVSAESQEQIRALQHAIRENTRKLEEVQQRKLRVEEEIIQCTRETNRREDLMMDKSEIVHALQQLRDLLQDEMHLLEQLNSQSSEDRSQAVSLHERNESVKTQASRLVAEILEVKQHLEEVKSVHFTAQALPPVSIRKSKRNPTNQ